MTDAIPDPSEALNQKKLLRLRIMQFLYGYSNGDEMKWVSGEEIAESVDADQYHVGVALDYLEGEGLAKIHGMGGGGLWGITHFGVVEVEQSISEPDRPTHHFPPAASIVLVQGNVTNSAIQAGTSESRLDYRSSGSGETSELIRQFISEVRSHLDELAENHEQRLRLEADLTSVEMQVGLEEPNEGVVREGLRSLRSVVESAAGGGLLMSLAELARQLPV